jgi:hypothetical protein
MAKDRGKDRHTKTEGRRVYQRQYQRIYAWRTKYGLTEADVQKLIGEQGGCCPICARQFDMKSLGRGRADLFPHIDHDHQTGLVRGLLCNSCNVSIGRLRDCTVTLQRAISYLTRNKQTAPGAR